jgi:hypothetical protein
MPMFATMQHNWVEALYQRDVTPSGLRNAVSEKRFEIYRASLLANLGNALADVYPVIKKLVGATFFDAMAQRYISGQPSEHGDISVYGKNFAVFLQNFAPARELGYLPDMARLEWCVHQAFHAADGAALKIDALATLSSEALASSGFILHPSLQLLQSDYPLQQIWQMHQNNSDDVTVDLNSGAVNLLIFRQHMDMVILPVSLSEFNFVQRLHESRNLATACEQLVQSDDDFDVGHILHGLFSLQLVHALPDLEETTK